MAYLDERSRFSVTVPVQAFPTEPPLCEHADLSLPEVEARIDGLAQDRPVYPYVVASVRAAGGGFCQQGCSPNFQGGLITLCDCKHHMRSFGPVCDRNGVWIAGLTSGGITSKRRRYVFYLMFARPVASHAELWSKLPTPTRNAKSATRNRLGDVYEPIKLELAGAAAFDSQNYRPPVPHHAHEAHDVWRRDIEEIYGNRRPCLLVGDSALSFIWSRPKLRLVENAYPLPRNPRSSTSIGDWLLRLRSEDASPA